MIKDQQKDYLLGILVEKIASLEVHNSNLKQAIDTLEKNKNLCYACNKEVAGTNYSDENDLAFS